jgi:hypothetical protein
MCLIRMTSPARWASAVLGRAGRSSQVVDPAGSQGPARETPRRYRRRHAGRPDRPRNGGCCESAARGERFWDGRGRIGPLSWGGAEGTRTPDFLHAMAARPSQASTRHRVFHQVPAGQPAEPARRHSGTLGYLRHRLWQISGKRSGLAAAPEPKLPTRCAGRCAPGLCQAFELGGRQSVVPSCTRSSRGVVASPVSNLVSIGFRSRLVADAIGAPVLRDQGPDRPAGHGKADVRLDVADGRP